MGKNEGDSLRPAFIEDGCEFLVVSHPLAFVEIAEDRELLSDLECGTSLCSTEDEGKKETLCCPERRLSTVTRSERAIIAALARPRAPLQRLRPADDALKPGVVAASSKWPYAAPACFLRASLS